MDQRLQFIADYQRDVFDVAELARRYGIGRKTAYKWIDRYDVGGPAGLVDRSRRSAQCPHGTPPPIIAALLDVRRHHPTWGAKKLLKIVATRHPTWRLPGTRVVSAVRGSAATTGSVTLQNRMIEGLRLLTSGWWAGTLLTAPHSLRAPLEP